MNELSTQQKQINADILTAAMKRESLWTKALWKFKRDRAGLFALSIVLIYFVVALLATFNVVGVNWDKEMTDGYSDASSAFPFGTTINGQDVLSRALYGTKTAFEVGLVVAVFSTLIGWFLGSVAGFFSGTILDEIIIWLYGCLECIPFYLFVAAVAFALRGNPYAMHIAMVSTFWTSTCRVIRGEVIKIKHLEYVEAARAIGVSRFKIIVKHIMPNTLHIVLVNSTISFVGAIKSEVILSFLGLGVKEGVSWGVMISESTGEVSAGRFNNFLAASTFLFFLVIAFNLFADSLQDALDPKKVS